MSGRLWVLLVSAAVATGFIFGDDLRTRFVRWWKIDAGLDAGGRWDRARDTCDGTR